MLIAPPRRAGHHGRVHGGRLEDFGAWFGVEELAAGGESLLRIILPIISILSIFLK